MAIDPKKVVVDLPPTTFGSAYVALGLSRALRTKPALTGFVLTERTGAMLFDAGSRPPTSRPSAERVSP